MFPLNLYARVHFVLCNRTRDRGCSAHPVFPAPSVLRRANEMQNFGRLAPRDQERMSHNVIARSEATKQSISSRKERMDCFVARAPRNDGALTCSPDERSDIRGGVRVVPDVAALIRATKLITNTTSRSRGAMRPEFCWKPCPMKIRGRRESRVHAAPAVSRANDAKDAHTSIQVQRRHSDFPCAMVLRLTSCSPR